MIAVPLFMKSSKFWIITLWLAVAVTMLYKYQAAKDKAADIPVLKQNLKTAQQSVKLAAQAASQVEEIRVIDTEVAQKRQVAEITARTERKVTVQRIESLGTSAAAHAAKIDAEKVDEEQKRFLKEQLRKSVDAAQIDELHSAFERAMR